MVALKSKSEKLYYARLSFQTGLFAGIADELLGYDHFTHRCRAEAWSLTNEKLQAWKAEAIAMGVSEQAINEKLDYFNKDNV